MSSTPRPQIDDRPAQALRVANYLEKHPNSTGKEIDKACDTGCITKVLSDMAKTMGYGIGKDWRNERCDQGNRTRRVRTYKLLYRPTTQPDLFAPA